VARLRTSRATSAGGVGDSAEGDRPSLVVGMRRRGRDGVTWTLPKGTPSRGETTEETALREVREETGLQVRITAPLPSIEYTFIQDGTRIRKTVHYFLMEPTGGDLARHDHEFEAVRWVPFSEAGALLSFQTERDLVATAESRLGAGSSGPAPRQPAAASS
jgi:8-oxo-dGTP pyrophosphatase MutT (NUDIX family)